MARGNFTTGAERYNKRMHKIFDSYNKIKEKESTMTYDDLIKDGYSKETARHIVLERKLKKMSGL